jgi:hypothetical protein
MRGEKVLSLRFRVRDAGRTRRFLAQRYEGTRRGVWLMSHLWVHGGVGSALCLVTRTGVRSFDLHSDKRGDHRGEHGV